MVNGSNDSLSPLDRPQPAGNDNNRGDRSDKFFIDYKNVRFLMKFVSERGKIIPSRVNSLNKRQQREVSKAIKRARILALMPFVNR
jgi:small subunit ribosomal protein S18